MGLSAVCRPCRAHFGALFNGMEPADDGAQLFYHLARLNLYLRRRGGVGLARHTTADSVKKDILPARRACLRVNMGALAPAAVVHRRPPQPVDALLVAGDAGHIPLFLAGHNTRTRKVRSAVYALPRPRQCVAFIVRAQAQLDIDYRHYSHYGGIHSTLVA